ncbi:cation:proton antiporter [Fuerstiella marisgermanici]|uniref:EIIABC-Fru n=1 Tax=Fuerstiella marisgermanici TaxID=1891926 RepID=A0A1P8WSF1_9PLAN|nr:cation:proton antiporter [Fuerstiella marisgermanici]APZ96976.1 EIIABC-Fru [Fuerstiella marisgermanici]
MPADANVLLILAVILVVGTVSASFAKMLHLPSVTGQIVAGVLMGPSVFAVLTEQSLDSFEPLVDFALGLMAVAVGSHLNFRRLAVARRRLTLLLLFEATITPLFVFSLLMLFTDITSTAALLLATVAISTAPATVLAIVKETASKGAFVTTLVAAVALNNLACIILFELARTAALASQRAAVLTPDIAARADMSHPFISVAFSLLLGFTIGVLLILATMRIVRTDRLSVMSLIAILLTTGLTEELGLSVLLACLCMGVTLANLTPDKEEIGHRVFESFETAIFAVFFTVAGMELNFQSLAIGGLLAVIAFCGRLAGKVTAGYLSMRISGATQRFRRWIGLSLTPQAGLAVGLMLLVTDDAAFDEELRSLFLTVVLAMVLLNEIVGPILTRMSLKRSGDFGRDRARVLDFLSEQNITTTLAGPDKESAIRRLVDMTVGLHKLSIDADTLFDAVMDAENTSSTCVGEGLALPHARLDVGDKIIGAMGISREGLALDSPDQRPVHCMVLIITPTTMPERHLEVLQALAASIGRDRSIQQQLYHIDSPAHADELIHLDQQFEDWNYYLDDGE